jgi:hypothetical protein
VSEVAKVKPKLTEKERQARWVQMLRAAQSEEFAVLNPEHVTFDEARMQITAL